MIPELKAAFLPHSNRLNAEKQEVYMKNLFPYFGLPKPLRAALQKEVFSSFAVKTEDQLIKIMLGLWEMEEREYQYAALDLSSKYSKLLTPSSLPALEQMIRQKSWWDTVDHLAGKCLGGILLKAPQTISLMDTWIDDESMWIRRSALLYPLKWKKATDEKKLFAFCEKRAGEKEFFIRKAIGWILREYSKTNPAAVRAFLEAKGDSLSGLSRREAGKYL